MLLTGPPIVAPQLFSPATQRCMSSDAVAFQHERTGEWRGLALTLVPDEAGDRHVGERRRHAIIQRAGDMLKQGCST